MSDIRGGKTFCLVFVVVVVMMFLVVTCVTFHHEGRFIFGSFQLEI